MRKWLENAKPGGIACLVQCETLENENEVAGPFYATSNMSPKQLLKRQKKSKKILCLFLEKKIYLQSKRSEYFYIAHLRHLYRCAINSQAGPMPPS